MKLGTKLKVPEELETWAKLSLHNVCEEFSKKYSHYGNKRLFKVLLTEFDDDLSDVKKFLNAYWSVFKDKCPDDWNKNSKGLIFNGSVFRGLLIILYEIMEFWRSKNELSDNLSDLDNIQPKFEFILEKLIIWINDREPEDIDQFKKENRGAGGPKGTAIEFSSIINKKRGLENFAQNLRTSRKGFFEIESILEMLNNGGEREDLEAKKSIWGTHPDIDSRKNRAVDQLSGLIAMYNTIGGRIVIGIEEPNPQNGQQFTASGCDEDIKENTGARGLEEYKVKLSRMITRITMNKVPVKIHVHTLNGKTIIIIDVRRSTNSQLVNIGDLKPMKLNDGSLVVKVRQDDESVDFETIGDLSVKQSVLENIQQDRNTYEFITRKRFKEIIDSDEESESNSVEMITTGYRLKF